MPTAHQILESPTKTDTCFPVPTYIGKEVFYLKAQFILSAVFGGLWLAISTYYAIGWAGELTQIFSAVYVWWVIVGIALLPGFLMSMMFLSAIILTISRFCVVRRTWPSWPGIFLPL